MVLIVCVQVCVAHTDTKGEMTVWVVISEQESVPLEQSMSRAGKRQQLRAVAPCAIFLICRQGGVAWEVALTCLGRVRL